MATRYKILFIAGVLVVLMGALLGCTPGKTDQSSEYPYPRGGVGPGWIMGPGGMMRSGGMMGLGGPYRTGGNRITMDQATTVVDNYLQQLGNADLRVDEIMEFQYNYYVQFSEKSTGIKAFEALIDPYTGDLYPEPGPNMMWNAKYGMMSGVMWGTPGITAPMSVTEEQAKQFAQKFVDGYLPGAKVGQLERFYGYYTLHVLKDGQIYGMLSVNGYTGQVWYHSWHGQFIAEKEFD
jgi:hypothetical protein